MTIRSDQDRVFPLFREIERFSAIRSTFHRRERKLDCSTCAIFDPAT